MILKMISLALTALMILPIGYASLFALTFGSVAQNTVVKIVPSPSGKYCAQVIDSDQGAMGGDTIVEVSEQKEINAILFRMKKDPRRVYSGEWGEYRSMDIYWKNDACLVINSVEHPIE